MVGVGVWVVMGAWVTQWSGSSVAITGGFWVTAAWEAAALYWQEVHKRTAATIAI